MTACCHDFEQVDTTAYCQYGSDRSQPFCASISIAGRWPEKVESPRTADAPDRRNTPPGESGAAKAGCRPPIDSSRRAGRAKRPRPHPCGRRTERAGHHRLSSPRCVDRCERSARRTGSSDKRTLAGPCGNRGFAEGCRAHFAPPLARTPERPARRRRPRAGRSCGIHRQPRSPSCQAAEAHARRPCGVEGHRGGAAHVGRRAGRSDWRRKARARRARLGGSVARVERNSPGSAPEAPMIEVRPRTPWYRPCRGLLSPWAVWRVRFCSGALSDRVRFWPPARGLSDRCGRDAGIVGCDDTVRRSEPSGGGAGDADLGFGGAGAGPVSFRCVLRTGARHRSPPRTYLGSDHIRDRQDGDTDDRRPPLPQPIRRHGQGLHARCGAVDPISGGAAGDPIGHDRVLTPAPVKVVIHRRSR